MTLRLSPRARPALLLALAVLLLVCWSGPAPAARRSLHYDFVENEVASYQFESRRLVRTGIARLPAEADRFDHAPVFQRIAEVESRLEGRLERFNAKRYRDGTVGIVARLVGLSGTIQRGDEAVERGFDELEGRSLSYRTHTSGELLDSHGWSHFMGGGRGGELAQDVFLQSVLRLPRHLPRGEQTITNSFTVRVPVDPALERSTLWMVRYSSGPTPEDCGPRCWAVDYSGELSESSTDKHPARPMTRKGLGTVSGRILLAGRGRAKRLLAHEWTITWDRRVASQRPNGTLRGELTQTVEASGNLRLLPPEEG